MRDLWPEQILVVKAMKQNIVIRLLFRLAGYLYHHTDRVVTVGDGYKEQIQAGYNVPDEQIDVMVGSLMSLLEPIMILVLGVIVMTIVLAVFLPMIKIITTLSV